MPDIVASDIGVLAGMLMGARPMSFDRLPDGLPVPIDDGAANHLAGHDLPDLDRPTAQRAARSIWQLPAPRGWCCTSTR